MRHKMIWEWQELDTATKRAQVIGGWLIVHTSKNSKGQSESMTFVPDRDHLWTIVKPIKDVPPPLDKKISEGY